MDDNLIHFCANAPTSNFPVLGRPESAEDRPNHQSTSQPLTSRPHEPVPLCLSSDWLPLSWAQRKERHVTSGRSYPRSPVVANFVILGKEDISEEIIKATYKELTEKEGRYIIELRGTPPRKFIHIETGSEQETRTLVETARELANELTSDQSASTPALFQEPLTTHMKQYRITLVIQGSVARPQLDYPLNGSLKHEWSTEFRMSLNRAIYQGLKKTNRQQPGLTLRVHLGHYVLQKYPRGQSSFEYEQFRAMVDSPRNPGRLVTEMANESTVRNILTTIQQSSGPLLPTDNQTPSAIDVMPDHIFEAHWENGRLQADIVATARDSKMPATEGLRYQMNRVRTFHGKSDLSELRFTILSIGRKFDWDIEVSRDGNLAKVNTTGIDQFLSSATIRMQGCNFECFPRIMLRRNDLMGKALKNVTVKSIYRFRWKATAYIVEIIINRRWTHIHDMGQPPKLDFSITIYGEHWDQLSRGGTEAAGNAWGDDLDILFNDGENAVVATGQDRVGRFVSVVQDVQSVLEKA